LADTNLKPASAYDPTRPLSFSVDSTAPQPSLVPLLHALRQASGRRSTTLLLITGSSPSNRRRLAQQLAGQLHKPLIKAHSYIGETEKNLSQQLNKTVANHLLLFDEADAWFGKGNGSVKDSHDRYANLETNYLLRSLGQYRGIIVFMNPGVSSTKFSKFRGKMITVKLRP